MSRNISVKTQQQLKISLNVWMTNKNLHTKKTIFASNRQYTGSTVYCRHISYYIQILVNENQYVYHFFTEDRETMVMSHMFYLPHSTNFVYILHLLISDLEPMFLSCMESSLRYLLVTVSTGHGKVMEFSKTLVQPWKVMIIMN